MRAITDQVPLWELLALAVVSFLGFAFGYSLNLFALILIVFWPLLLFQMIFEGAVIGAFLGLRRLIFGPRAPKPPAEEPAEPPADPAPRRTGIARWLWHLPFVCLALGWLKHYADTGSWFGI